eukprot:scaffold34779_cov18-Tisochrysis_lutea.AAC.1
MPPCQERLYSECWGASAAGPAEPNPRCLFQTTLAQVDVAYMHVISNSHQPSLMIRGGHTCRVPCNLTRHSGAACALLAVH